MFTKTRTMVIGLALVGVVVVAGAVYGATAWAAGPPASSTSTQAPQTATEAQQRAVILDMIEDHMGLTGAEAENLADQMIARCPRFSDDATAGDGDWGMMDGSGGCLNGEGSAGGSTRRGMMGTQGGMMGSWN